MMHELKILPVYFEAVQSGDKTFEIRNNLDRGFQKGDTLLLKEYEPARDGGILTGRALKKVVSYVTNYEQKDGFVVLGLRHPIDAVNDFRIALQLANTHIDDLIKERDLLVDQLRDNSEQCRVLVELLREARHFTSPDSLCQRIDDTLAGQLS